MNTIYLKEFIKIGKFGPISIGSKKSDLVDTLGKNFDFANCGETQIISYGWYEFFYWTETEIIFGIQNDHLIADFIGHSSCINFKNKLWTIDKWFLQDNKNITFEQVIAYLNQEDITFDIIPAYKGSEENIIKCTESNVTLDFDNSYRILELNEKGKLESSREINEVNQPNFVLNGIRLFD